MGGSYSQNIKSNGLTNLLYNAKKDRYGICSIKSPSFEAP